MAAKFVVTTEDLHVKFWEKSFSVKGCIIWTNRKIERYEGSQIARVLQSLVDHGRGNPGPDFRNYVERKPPTVTDGYLIQENEQLKQRLAELGEDL